MNEKIVLLDEKGEEKEFEVLATFGLDDSNYAVLFPVDNIDDEVHILKIEHEDNGDLILVGIEDEQEFSDAILAYESILKDDME